MTDRHLRVVARLATGNTITDGGERMRSIIGGSGTGIASVVSVASTEDEPLPRRKASAAAPPVSHLYRKDRI
jgi:hypothetical protein